MEPTIQPTGQRPAGKWLTLILIILVFFLAGLTSYLTYQNQLLQKQITEFTQLNQTPPIVQDNTTVPLPLEVPQSEVGTPDPTADWQAYISQKYDYSIQYPSLWKKNHNSAVAQTNFLGSEMSISITYSQHAADMGNAGGCKTQCNFTAEDGSYNWILLKQKKDEIDSSGLIIRGTIQDDNQENRNLINQILSTFQFTN